mmetsp:Transcript_14478/g.17893  ORF Transcript_14478/g.17893 Transcript_14478/m.17893 type:complete len:198 (+) Transcript_14478:362-955(+)
MLPRNRVSILRQSVCKKYLFTFNADLTQNDDVNIYEFPLDPCRGPFLCSQGFGGHFTHFFAGTHHAVDFECPVGTPVVAIGDGVVTNVRDVNVVTGIHGSNLFKWNSVTVKMHDGNYAEYVHIQRGSVCVEVGQAVSTGQLLCLSGSVGFSPRPHLHLQVTRDATDSAPTIPFRIKRSSEHVNETGSYEPKAGFLYP